MHMARTNPMPVARTHRRSQWPIRETAEQLGLSRNRVRGQLEKARGRGLLDGRKITEEGRRALRAGTPQPSHLATSSPEQINSDLTLMEKLAISEQRLKQIAPETDFAFVQDRDR